MGNIVPSAIEAYLASLNAARDPLLDDLLQRGRSAGLPLIDAEVGALLQVLVTAVGARRILEIGTAIGYSGLWMARALPTDGHLFTFEIDPARAEQAAANFAHAGVADRTHVMVGDAQRLVAKVAGPFDLIFNDGDKHLFEPLLDRLIALLRPRGLLVVDNVLWDGEVVPGFVERPRRDPAETRAIAAFNRRVAADARLLTTVLPIRDGVSVSAKVGP